MGGTPMDDIITAEELSRGSTAVAMSVGVTTAFGARAILFSGNEEQKRFFLPKIAEGEIRFAMAVTEPDGGTDILGALKTFARQDGNDFYVNGQKISSATPIRPTTC